jgi:AraC family transcriptional activator of mtrCDE
MTDQTIPRIARLDLDSLITHLDVEFLQLSECLVSHGWRLELTTIEAPAIHYNLAGSGQMIIDHHPPIELRPHALIIVPQGHRFILEGPANSETTWRTLDATEQDFPAGSLRKLVAGDGVPQIMLICGYFRALYGPSVDLFAALSSPIVEYYDATDRLEHPLKAAMAELIAQEVAMKAMTTVLLKQVLVALLRRSLSSLDLWAARFSMLSDLQIAGAFAEMVSRPNAAHSIQSLSRNAGLSRSAFMTRFATAFGQSPIAVLRQLRMRQAALLLASNTLPVDQIAQRAGYASRSSFSRAFKAVYGSDPTEYRDKRRSS